ncbi:MULTISPECIES: hypothetical protein [Streptomycetaceae]|uniref:hypothetical protein n=1 Tax=Streptomycetaceae TaxID=2062 RepID=UPI00093B81E4|nr:hypothetical protein [Streptomyces sp. CB02056]OKI08522.1 hypothetical protein AMK13_08410 [Streptomyces sp. CB02056]
MSAEHDGPEERFERAFAEALGRAGEAYDTEPGPLVDTGWSHGRRLRRRRRIGTAAGAAGLALIAVGGVALGGLPPGRSTAAAGPAAAPSASPVSGAEFQRMLTELLPPGTVQVGEARGTESDTPQLRLVLDDGHGPAQYLFWITGMGGKAFDMDCPAGVPAELPAGQPTADACSASTLPDGTRLSVYQAGTRTGEPEGAKTWAAKLAGEHYQMMLQEWNRKPLDQGTPITRTDPPLMPDQLTAVVKDPRWKKVVAALPKGPVMGVVVTPAPGAASTYVPDSVVTGPVTLPAFPKPGS